MKNQFTIVVNPGSIKYSVLHNREDVTKTMFKWTDNIYRKRLFRKPKLIVKEGFVYLPLVINNINNLDYIQNYLDCKCVYLLNELRDGKHDIWAKFDIEYADNYSESRIFIKPYVKVEFIDGTYRNFWFDTFEEAENFNKNIHNHPTVYAKSI